MPETTSNRRFIDLRSDTVTVPTPEMREAMYRAEVGDDVYGEDPTVNRLEELAAAKVGKEAAVFVASGTMGNLVSVLAQTQHGDEVILEADAHIFYYEAAGIARFGGCQTRTIRGRRGAMDPAEVEAAVRGKNIHYPRTSLICLENTHNRAGGTVIPLANMAAIKGIADRHGLRMHLDGARVFNAAVALGVEVTEITSKVDSVQFCLSKGLSAPVGSIIAGTREFAERARAFRKAVGGGMRQAGVIAAAGIVALERMTARLAEDHAHAARLARGLATVTGLQIDLAQVETNIVMINFEAAEGSVVGAAAFTVRMKEHGVLCGVMDERRVRMVTHCGIAGDDVDAAVEAARRAMRPGERG
jgi:threonine aldolase